jgi:hypothetical protein
MIRIGTAADPAYLREADYAATLAREFNQLEPENVMKFGPIHPGLTTYNFGPADALVTFATEHNKAESGALSIGTFQVSRWRSQWTRHLWGVPGLGYKRSVNSQNRGQPRRKISALYPFQRCAFRLTFAMVPYRHYGPEKVGRFQ